MRISEVMRNHIAPGRNAVNVHGFDEFMSAHDHILQDAVDDVMYDDDHYLTNKKNQLTPKEAQSISHAADEFLSKINALRQKKVMGYQNLLYMLHGELDEDITVSIIDTNLLPTKKSLIERMTQHIVNTKYNKEYVDNFVIGSITIEEYQSIHQIDTTTLDKAYIGQGLMVNVYATLILKENFTLASGQSQSAGAIKLWRELSKIRGIAMYAYDEDSEKIVQVFQTDDDDIENAFDTELGLSHDEFGDDALKKANDDMIFDLRTKENKLYRLWRKAHDSGNTKREESLRAQLDAIDKQIEDLHNDSNTGHQIVLIATKGTTSRDTGQKHRNLR